MINELAFDLMTGAVAFTVEGIALFTLLFMAIPLWRWRKVARYTALLRLQSLMKKQ